MLLRELAAPPTIQPSEESGAVIRNTRVEGRPYFGAKRVKCAVEARDGGVDVAGEGELVQVGPTFGRMHRGQGAEARRRRSVRVSASEMVGLVRRRSMSTQTRAARRIRGPVGTSLGGSIEGPSVT